LPTFDRALLAAYLRPEWRRAVLLALLLLSAIALQLANPQIVKAFIDHAQSGAPLSLLLTIAAGFLAVAVLTQVASVVETFVAEDLGWRTTNALRADLTRRALELEGAFHAEHGVGELMERIDGDVTAVADFFSSFVVQILGSGILLAGMLVLLYLADWRVGAVLTAFSLLGLLFVTRGGGFVAVKARASRQAAAELTGYLEERLAGLPDLKANGADEYTLYRLDQRLAARFRTAWAAARAGSLFNGGVGAIFAVAMGAALALSAVLHESGLVTLGTVYVVFRYTGMLQQPIEALSIQMNVMQQATGATVRIRELLETKSEVVGGAGAILPDGGLTVKVENVSFAYASAPVLDNVSFHLDAGHVLGLLGRTGSGKTTIARLLFRLQDPTAGVIRVGGVDIRDLRLEQLRSRVGFVTQDVHLFHGTIRENISLFDGNVPASRVHEAFEHLGLQDWLAGLPQGLETRLGPGGRGLSAGEAQLLGLARVFLKDPGLVVLDEASSRLDPVTLLLVERGISRLLENRTGVIIAHRLETVERADRILILEDGRVAEMGDRESLVRDAKSKYSILLRTGLGEALA